MLKLRKILVILLVSMLLSLCLLTTVNAAEDGTQEIKVEQLVPGTDGSIKFVISGLQIQDGQIYEYGLEKGPDTEPTTWKQVVTTNSQKGEIQVDLLASNEDDLNLLKTTDTAYITIRTQDTQEVILQAEKLDLTLPLLKAFNVAQTDDYDEYYGGNRSSVHLDNVFYNINTVYGINTENIKYLVEKVTDIDTINNYVNGEDLSTLNLPTLEDMPSLNDSRWKNVTRLWSFENLGILGQDLKDLDDGLYYLWMTTSDEGIKTINGLTLIEIGNVTTVGPGDDGNQDNNNNNNSNNNNNNDGNSNNNINNNTPTNNNKNNTSTITRLPNAGKNVAIFGGILLVTILAIASYARYRYLKGIK